MEMWEHYESCLEHHDWYFEYSDDPKYWVAGRQEHAYIVGLRKVLGFYDGRRAQARYNFYCPWIDAAVHTEA